ncbi:hypothetical protein N9930_01885, partial [bacterium]|nr:hypothetical protein [bacterium]
NPDQHPARAGIISLSLSTFYREITNTDPRLLAWIFFLRPTVQVGQVPDQEKTTGAARATRGFPEQTTMKN